MTSQGTSGDWSRREILDPALDKLLGNLEGCRVLDVGCGEGRYCRVLHEKGAIVTGLDPVEEFITTAKSLHPDGSYSQGFAEFLPYLSSSYDLVLSYLSLVDILDYKAAIAEMARVMKPTGRIIVVSLSNLASCTTGWVKNSEGKRLYRTVDRYMEEFTLNLEWSGISIENFHRPLSAVLGAFFKQGLVLTDFQEPLPEPPTLCDEHRAPTFQIMTFARRSPVI